MVSRICLGTTRQLNGLNAGASCGPETDVSRSDNSLSLQQPYHLPMTLQPGDSTEVSVTIHASQVGERELSLLFVYREVGDSLLFL